MELKPFRPLWSFLQTGCSNRTFYGIETTHGIMGSINITVLIAPFMELKLEFVSLSQRTQISSNRTFYGIETK